jgi:hypothetical protein
LQEECVRRRLAKSGTKADLLARLQLHESQQKFGNNEVQSNIEEEFSHVVLKLGTLIPDSPIIMDELLMYALPEDAQFSDPKTPDQSED